MRNAIGGTELSTRNTMLRPQHATHPPYALTVGRYASR
jgi:hypothetical protein